MVKNWIMRMASSGPQEAARSAWLLLGAGGLLVASAGCSAPVDPAEGQEIVGETSEALDSIFESFDVYPGGHVKAVLKHTAFNDGSFRLRYGRVGSPPSTVANKSGIFEYSDLIVGASYTFSATECSDGRFPRPLGASCSTYSASFTVLMSYAETDWRLSTDLAADDLASAYSAGSLVVDGATVSVPFCSMLYGSGAIPGYFNAGQCNGFADGLAVTSPTAYVLKGLTGSAVWSSYSASVLPPQAIVAGYFHNRPLYACRGLADAVNWIPGWTFGDECHGTYGGALLTTPAGAAQILTLN